MAHHFILLRLNLFGVDMEGLRVCLSAEGTKNVSWPWLSPLQGWGSLTMTSTGKFIYILYLYMYVYIYTHIYTLTMSSHKMVKHTQVICLQLQGIF